MNAAGRAMSERDRTTVEHATVRVMQAGGLGVLVPGQLIVTAAHCISWDASGAMVLGDHFLEEVTTADGRLLKVAPLAVEPVADIAVLGALDAQDFSDEVNAFEDFCENTEPVRLSVQQGEPGEPFPVFVWTHHGQWINAEATVYGDGYGGSMSVRSPVQIEGGTSGGPIVSADGRLVGIVSNFSVEPGGDCYGTIPRAHLTIPPWLLRRMLA